MGTCLGVKVCNLTSGVCGLMELDVEIWRAIQEKSCGEAK